MDQQTAPRDDKPVRIPRYCDAAQLHAVMVTAGAWLKAHEHEVDALNVYPVPDGDTGSNMSQTMRAAVDEAGAFAEPHAGKYAALLAHGALMGARGNSGVILSQLMRGFARALTDARTFTPSDLADALQEASAMAYRAVMKPVEGTILTVSRVAAEEAVRAAADQADFQHVLSATVSAARRAVAETRNQLPVLRQAGVVDAGGRGYLLILEGALRHLQGKQAVQPDEVAAAPSRAAAPEHAGFDHPAEVGFGYCTEFMIAGDQLNEHQVRQALSQFGESLLVVGGQDLLRVHLHTDDPGRALSYAASLGRIRKVKVDDMQAQHTAFAAEVPAGSSPPVAVAPSLPIGVVAVAAGEGFSALFSSLGAWVVPGGQTMNPSTEQILQAIQSCPQRTVLVLPNNGNVVTTAEQAAVLSGREVRVVPTESMPQGVAALLAVRYDEELEQILLAIASAIQHVRTLELTTAVRDAEMDNLRVHRGDILGMLDGKLVIAGEDEPSVATALLDLLPAGHYEVLSVFPGAKVSAQKAETFADLLRRRYPEMQVELLAGGQPHYQYVLSAE